MKVKITQSCLTLRDAHGQYSPWNSPSQKTGVDSHSLLQGIFPTQEPNRDLLHCGQILYQLSYNVTLVLTKCIQHSAASHHSTASALTPSTHISCLVSRSTLTALHKNKLHSKRMFVSPVCLSVQPSWLRDADNTVQATQCSATTSLLGLPCWADGEESACSVGDSGSIPGLERFPGEGTGNPFWYSCLENPTDRGAWRAAVRGVAKSGTRLSD